MLGMKHRSTGPRVEGTTHDGRCTGPASECRWNSLTSPHVLSFQVPSKLPLCVDTSEMRCTALIFGHAWSSFFFLPCGSQRLNSNLGNSGPTTGTYTMSTGQTRPVVNFPPYGEIEHPTYAHLTHFVHVKTCMRARFHATNISSPPWVLSHWLYLSYPFQSLMKLELKFACTFARFSLFFSVHSVGSMYVITRTPTIPSRL